MKKIKEMIKDNKEMIIPILVGFTFLTSIYSTIKISQLEREIYYLDSDFHDTGLNGEDERDELSDRIYDIENEVEYMKLRMGIYE